MRRSRAERALRRALDHERPTHEAVRRADELQHLDLDLAAVEREAHRRADDADHRAEHDDREHALAVTPPRRSDASRSVQRW